MAHYIRPITIGMGPELLSSEGFNIPVMLTSMPMKKNGPQPIRKIVLAHLDTGSNVTTVDKRLAVDLGLILVGGCTTHTAAGPIDANKYMVNITFPNTELKGFNLIVNDCVLHYDPHAETLNPEFFAMVIGRDIMEHWNIVWNGPSSTVIISD